MTMKKLTTTIPIALMWVGLSLCMFAIQRAPKLPASTVEDAVAAALAAAIFVWSAWSACWFLSQKHKKA